jgi:hypothetical protein
MEKHRYYEKFITPLNWNSNRDFETLNQVVVEDYNEDIGFYNSLPKGKDKAIVREFLILIFSGSLRKCIGCRFR